MILLIDNYDSFVYNLYQMVGAIEPDIRVVRNDAITVEDIASLGPDALILSPGPGRPEDAGVCAHAVRQLTGNIPILGVCLGHQAICEAFGATVGYAKQLMHGKTSIVRQVTGDCAEGGASNASAIPDPAGTGAPEAASPIFAGLPEAFPVARYHSLAADAATLPDCLRITARAEDGEVMAVEHASAPTFGVQFHPESVMTPDGARMLANFVDIARRFGEGRCEA